MKKKTDTLVKEYVRRISDDELRKVAKSISQKVAGDRAECAQIFERDKEVNRWLCSASSAEEWFDMVESIEEAAQEEYARRSENKAERKRHVPRDS
jgi:RNA polymerase subunit RPABC4/transcription elongation factor Spt4